MNFKTTVMASMLALSLPSLGACSISHLVAPELREAQRELTQMETSNITLNGSTFSGGPGNNDVRGPVIGRNDTTLPKAEITPAGDLIVENKAVSITSLQRSLLLDYRHEIIDLAKAGVTIGGKGADLAGMAVRQVLVGMFTGNLDRTGQRIDKAGASLDAEARLLCNQIPPMLATQQKLAASLPAFKPYANLTQGDIDDCMDDNDRAIGKSMRDAGTGGDNGADHAG